MQRSRISIRRTTYFKGLSVCNINDPNLIERTGSGGKNEGTITSFYTILADSDDTNDPVVDTARAILDGHIVLSKTLHSWGFFLQ